MHCINQVDRQRPLKRDWRIFILILLALGCSTQDQATRSSKVAESASKALESNKAPEAKSSSTIPTQGSESSNLSPNSDEAKRPNVEADSKSILSFDGKSLNDWQSTSFGGEGECKVENGAIVLEAGFPLTGITSTRKDLPKDNYEIELEARKTNGIDFFVGLTFPVKETHCSLIVGGWAGPVVGLSMLDGEDASNNETKRLMKFERNQWYRIRLQVAGNRIVAWIDDEKVVDQDVTGRQLSVRNETLRSRPLGICCFETRAEIRKFELKSMTPALNDKEKESSRSGDSKDGL